MRALALALALLLLGCETGGPVNDFGPIPYDAGPSCDAGCTVVVESGAAQMTKHCQAYSGNAYVAVGNVCMTDADAWKACKAKTPLACYKLALGACVLCVQPDAPP